MAKKWVRKRELERGGGGGGEAVAKGDANDGEAPYRSMTNAKRMILVRRKTQIRRFEKQITAVRFEVEQGRNLNER
jgi:hypothetical protein